MVDMENPGAVVALFDLDGTLCNAHSLGYSIVGYQFKNNPARIPSAVIYLMTQVAADDTFSDCIQVKHLDYPIPETMPASGV